MAGGGLKPIRITVPKGWHVRTAREQRTIETAVSRYLNAMAESLDIPVEWRPQIGEDSNLDSTLVCIEVSDQLAWASIAGFGHPVPNEQFWSGMDDVATNICRALCWARERLLDDTLVEQVWTELPSSAVTSDPEVRRWILTQALKMGQRLGSIAEALGNSESRVRDLRDAERWFERMLQTRGAGTLELLLPRALFDRAGHGAALERGYGADPRGLAEGLDMMGDELFAELGIRIGMKPVALDPDAPPDICRIRINDLPLPTFKTFAGSEFLVQAGNAALATKGLAGRAWSNPGDRLDHTLVRGGRREAALCEAAGWTTWGPLGYCVLHVASAVRSLAGAFVMPDVVALWLHQVSLVRPQLVHTALQKVAKEDMSATLRMLVDEGITVRDLRTILELFASEIEPLDVDTTEFIVYDLSAAMHRPALAADSAPMGPSVWCELVRVATKRLISHRVGRGGNRLDVVLLHNDLEKRLAGAKAIVAADEQRLIEQTAAALRRTPSGVASSAFVTSQDVRRLVREVLRSAFPNLSVLAYNELRTDMDIQPFARVAFD